MVIGSPHYRVTCPVLNSNLILVSDLINSNTRKWREELIVNIFAPVHTEHILHIPLVEVAHPDELAWCGESSKVFSVRSSYKLLLKNVANLINNLQPSAQNFYRKLWNLQFPAKVRIVVWCITNKFIPSRTNLGRRRLLSMRFYCAILHNKSGSC